MIGRCDPVAVTTMSATATPCARSSQGTLRPLTEAASVSDQANDPGLAKTNTAGSRGTRRPLGRWQEYAHALLLTNEASFVN
jgi:hypothetical protein